LALNLLTGPAGGLDGAFAVLSGCTSLPDKGSNPVIAEVGGQFTIGERIGKITEKKKLVTETQIDENILLTQ